MLFCVQTKLNSNCITTQTCPLCCHLEDNRGKHATVLVVFVLFVCLFGGGGVTQGTVSKTGRGKHKHSPRYVCCCCRWRRPGRSGGLRRLSPRTSRPSRGSEPRPGAAQRRGFTCPAKTSKVSAKAALSRRLLGASL